MKILRTNKLQRVLTRLQKKLTSSKGLILTYHRVAQVKRDPWCLCVTPQHFNEHLEVLQKYYNPLSLQQLVKALGENRIPERAVVVTFDDGYADNFYHAKPLLEKYNIPATFFISTGYIGQNREFWWDELERLILQPKKLPEKLRLTIGGNVYQWNLDQAANYTEEDCQRDRTCKTWKAKPGSRLFFYYSIWQVLRSLLKEERQKILDEILEWAVAEPTPRATHRSLLPEELSALAEGELVEIGAHTVTHPFLSAQSITLQRDEIKQSKIDLEQMINRPVTSFSYPFGDRSAETIEIVKNCGFNCTCSTDQDIIWPKSDHFQLPRFDAENWDKKQFENQLLKWFNS
ncbi:MAG: polysaccharide deacetylase [Snowella sp.]|jgi:peptidoglycan/xylan/chitin deacetylase (PgdA/CDA1 family)|nr:MAG: polysaccharide deacetylase [Snowella sp.]